MPRKQPMILPQGALDVISRLNHAGYHVYVVGGSVRDALRGITPHDYDMTTDATPEEMQSVFRDMRIIETGLKHGTLTILSDGRPYEVTTFRVDGDYEDHRHPDAVTFTRSLTEDLARRDFTMNAIAYHPTEGYIDPFSGFNDIYTETIRAVGDPATRFEEDALRILRCLRFASVLGYTIDRRTATAAQEKRDLLTHVSAERVREELCRLLCGDNVAEILTAYHDILRVRLPMLPAPTKWLLRAVTALPTDPVLRLIALMHPAFGTDGSLMDALMRDLRFDNAARHRATLLTAHSDTAILPERMRLLHLLSLLDAALTHDLCTLRAALVDEEEEQRTYLRARDLADALIQEGAPYRICDLALTGNDILAHTPLRGAAVGDALSALLDAVIDGKVENTRDALLTYLITQ